ncbi:uncharacterized protein LOC9638627 isoform X1 [Selaginella moellendorffii]|uniref:uncharacterized protein LOC9638627 isoform X1 n=1 Tax=Selaginella moellendorffii TaxID=88036 RepID=UPI000D1CB24B|nr:uncharacterized protein LOC9638627 isoform X1 [Selaginella moellendorffii]|eukprot:XP_024537970.1 uncharacterized protein LOC9638627 isoform X1 [Selaginella moellendorffii]
MALPWQWILDKLARQPDVSTETLRELAVYVPNAAAIPSLCKGLALRQFQEMLVSEEILDRDCGAEELILALASPDEDVSGMLQLIGDANSRTELFRFVQRKRQGLEAPVLDKIADDYTNGLYPPVARSLEKQEQQRGMPPVDEENEQNDGVPPERLSPRHMSVGSDDTTVVIDGSPDKAFKSPPRRGSIDEVSCEGEKNSVEKNGTEDHAAPSAPPVPEKHAKFQEGSCEGEKNSVEERGTENHATPSAPPEKQPFEAPKIIHSGNVSTRRSKRRMLMEDDDELSLSDVKPKLKQRKGMHEVEVINLDSDDDREGSKVVEKSRPAENGREEDEDGREGSKAVDEDDPEGPKTVDKNGRESLETGEKNIEDSRAKDSDKCYMCELRGKLVRCDDCPIALHPKCMAREQIREGEGWSCPKCVYKKAMEKLAKAQLEADRAKEKLESLTASHQVLKQVEDKEKENLVEHQVQLKVEEPSGSKDEAHARKHRARSSSSDEEDDEDDDDSDYPRKTNSNGRASIPNVRRKKMVWNSLEEETLRKGYQQYGSRWTTILQFGMGKFHPSRTGQDLKDKWRNMKKKRA